MINKFILGILFCFFSFNLYSQNLVYGKNGRIYNSNGEKLSWSQVDTIMSRNILVEGLYTEGRTKKSIGNIFLIGGIGLIATDLAIGLYADVQYPTALTIVGTGLFIISIPTKIGYSKKIKKAVDKFNTLYPEGYQTNSNTNLDFVLNANGFGLKITLN